MKTPLKYICLTALVLLPGLARAKLDVVATTPDLGALAEEIGGRNVKVTTLARPTEDPHFVDAKPSFIVKLNRAHALIEGGAQLEIGWLPALIESARNSKIALGAPGRIIASQGVRLLQVPSALDRSQGDIHAAGNPHYLVDPVNAGIVAQHIAAAFCQIDPKSCESYRANLKKFTDRLNAKLSEWQKQLEPFKGRRIVAYHDAWPYFAERFGLKIDLFLEPKPGIPPTPTHLAEVTARMKAENVRAIFVQPYLNRKTAEAVARATGAEVLDASLFPGGVKGANGGYIELMDYLVNGVARVLAGGGK